MAFGHRRIWRNIGRCFLAVTLFRLVCGDGTRRSTAPRAARSATGTTLDQYASSSSVAATFIAAVLQRQIFRPGIARAESTRQAVNSKMSTVVAFVVLRGDERRMRYRQLRRRGRHACATTCDPAVSAKTRGNHRGEYHGNFATDQLGIDRDAASSRPGAQ